MNKKKLRTLVHGLLAQLKATNATLDVLVTHLQKIIEQQHLHIEKSQKYICDLQLQVVTMQDKLQRIKRAVESRL